MMNKITFAFVIAIGLMSFGCKKKGSSAAGSVGAAMTKMTELKDEMCKCKDAKCAQDVSDKMMKWGQEQQANQKEPPKMGDEETKKAAAISDEMGKCMQTAMGAAGGGSAEPAVADKPLFERLGGLPAITVVVNEFIDRLVVDDVLNANPKIKEARDKVPAAYLKYHVTALVCQVTGGPCTYVGRNMKDSHAHLAITEAEWTEMAKVFKEILDKYKVPAKEQDELFKVVGSTKADIVAPAK